MRRQDGIDRGVARLMTRIISIALLLTACASPPVAGHPEIGVVVVDAAHDHDGDVGTDAWGGADAFVSDDAGIDAAASPDAWAPDAAPACTLAPQSGCSGAQACRITTTGPACQDVGAQPAEYSACTMLSDCAAGMQCVGGDPSVMLCRRFCVLGDTTACSSGRVCRAMTTLFLPTGDAVSLPGPIGICGSP